jgi:HEPN domain-containing protein
MPKRYPPDEPREWLNRAESDLLLAKTKKKGIYLEDLCFHAQQAVEKAIKALLIKKGVEFPYVHDIAELLTLLEKTGQKLPKTIREGEKLTRFAVFTRYPGIAQTISQKEYEEAIKVGEEVVRWVKAQFGNSPSKQRV